MKSPLFLLLITINSSFASEAQCNQYLSTEAFVSLQNTPPAQLRKKLLKKFTHQVKTNFVSILDEELDHVSFKTQELFHSSGALNTDILLIGEGDQSSIAALGLKASSPEKSVLVVIQSECLSLYDCIGDTHFSSSPEFLDVLPSQIPVLSKNQSTGMPIQLHELADKADALKVGNEYFLPGEVLGLRSRINFASSGADLLKHTKVLKVERSGDLGYSYKAHMSDGKIIRARRIISSSRLGFPVFPIEDSTSLKLATSDNKKGIWFVEDWLAKLQKYSRSGLDIKNLLRNKRIAVVGSGENGTMAIEAAMGKGPLKLYKTKMGEGELPQIYWVDQKNVTDSEYRTGTLARYHDLAEFFPSNVSGTGKITPVAGRPQKIEKTNEGTYVIYFAERKSVVVDEVIFTADVKDEAKTIFKEFTSEEEISTKLMSSATSSRAVKPNSTKPTRL